MNIHKHMRERTELARIYAEDGAFRTAADILRELSETVRSHAELADRAVAGLLRNYDRRTKKERRS